MEGAWAPNGECSACVVSKSAGSCRDLRTRSRSSFVSRLSFARLLSSASCFRSWDSQQCLPVLKPDLNLPGGQPRDLSGEALAMGGIGMGLPRELAHQEPSLVVGESGTGQLYRSATGKAPSPKPTGIASFSSSVHAALPLSLVVDQTHHLGHRRQSQRCHRRCDPSMRRLGNEASIDPRDLLGPSHRKQQILVASQSRPTSLLVVKVPECHVDPACPMTPWHRGSYCCCGATSATDRWNSIECPVAGGWSNHSMVYCATPRDRDARCASSLCPTYAESAAAKWAPGIVRESFESSEARWEGQLMSIRIEMRTYREVLMHLQQDCVAEVVKSVVQPRRRLKL
jgi:hypothetical protein